MTPQERLRVIEIIEAADEDASALDTLRTIAKELPHLTGNEFEEFGRVYREEKGLDAAVYFEQAKASGFIARLLREMGQPDLEHAVPVLVTRSEQGDHRATELLELLKQAFTVLSLVN